MFISPKLDPFNLALIPVAGTACCNFNFTLVVSSALIVNLSKELINSVFFSLFSSFIFFNLLLFISLTVVVGLSALRYNFILFWFSSPS